MKFKFIPFDYDYFDFEGRNYIKLIGRTKDNKKVCVIDEYKAKFFLILKDKTPKKEIEKLKEEVLKIKFRNEVRETSVLGVELQNKIYLGKKVLALEVFVSNHKDMHKVANEIGNSDFIVSRREYDIPIITKYITGGGLEPLCLFEISGNCLGENDFDGISNGLNVDYCVKIGEWKKINGEAFSPRVLSYDLECEIGEIGQGKILMIGLYGNDFKKVLTWGKNSKKHSYVETFKDEKEMIQNFIKYVKDFSPDILCGYFSDGYDLPFLKERAKKNKIKLSLGVDSREPRFTRGVFPVGKINGIVHVDLYRFIASVYSQYLSSETLSLNEVSNELLGEKKNDFDFSELKNKDLDWEKFFSYNLKDVELTYKLFYKLWGDMKEFVNIIREPLFDISRDTMATNVENYILHNLKRFNEIAEKRPVYDEIARRKSLGKYEGAFVYEPTPGLYGNLVFFDFTSMYGSVIVSYNLSKSTVKETKKLGEYKFSKKKGFFPILLEGIIALRKKYKAEYNENKNNLNKARSNAYKLLANAAYGYQGFFGARYYSREAAESTAKIAKENILKIIKKIEGEGYKILYSDTDSIAFERGKKSKREIFKFLDELNLKLPGIMELDLEDFYKRGLFVSKRATSKGAKKKYALIDESGNLKIRGFETVRRDWCKLARELQSKILRSVLINGDSKEAIEMLNKEITKIRNRTVDLEKLIIKTQLKKPLSDYVSQGPHVIAAKKMQRNGTIISIGMLIEYIVGEGRSKKISDKVFLPDEKIPYDVDYYLNHQILPSVENIFEVFGIKTEEISRGNRQTELFDFG